MGKINRTLVLCLDMAGCPNRCKHCWLGELPSGKIAEEEARWAVTAFKPYFKDITFYSWLREPDFLPTYQKRWEEDCALSTIKPERFELASFYRLVRDPKYVTFLKEVGVKKVQLTFFGGKTTTDSYVGREGAYEELLQSSDLLQGNQIDPRWQIFINEENKDEIEGIIALGKKKGIKEIFVHEGSCDGNNRKLYDIRIEKDHIPEAVKPYYLDYDGVFSEAELVERLKDNEDHYLPHNEGDIVLYVTSDFNIYFNFTNPSPAWRLGNLKADPIEVIVKRAVSEEVPALELARGITIGALVRGYGDPKSKRVFSEDDFKMYVLNTYLDGKMAE